MKKLILFLVLTFTAGGASAQSVQLSTYYPSPFGMYDRIRLVPRIALGEPCDPGTLYVENTGTTLRFCGAAGTWGTFAGVWTQAGDNLYPSDIANPNLKVGIGTTSPTSRLHVYAPEGYSPAGVFLDTADIDVNGGPDGQFRLRNNSASGTQKIFISGSAGDVLTVDTQAGSVGIATTTPGEELHLGQTVGDINLRLESPLPQIWDMGLSVGNFYPAGSFGIRNVTANNVPFVIDTAGNVGIGTNNPASKLEVNGADGAGVNGGIVGAVVNTNAGTSARALQTVSGAAASLSMIANGSSYAGGTWGNNQVGLYSNQNSKLHIENAAINSGLDIDSNGKITITARDELTLIGKNSVNDKVVFVEKALAIKKDLWGGVGPAEIGGQGLLYVRSGAGPGDDLYFKNDNGTEFNLSRGSIIETRMTNPGTPVTGQMWLCTDTGDATPCNGI